MEQKEFNKQVLAYFKERLEQGLCDIAFMESERIRAAELEDYPLAIAIREALHEIQRKESKKEA
jgi:hypothetical protein